MYTNRQIGGLEAKLAGEANEEVFDASLNYYRANGLVDWNPTYPEFVTLGYTTIKRNKVAYGYFKKQATSDRIVSIKKLGGMTCWIEIKKADAAKKKTIYKADHQLEQMQRSIEDGGGLGFFAIWWCGGKEDPQWVLYPADKLRLNEKRGIEFYREVGLLAQNVPNTDIPDWLPGVIRYATCSQR